MWIAKGLGLESTLRARGRPQKTKMRKLDLSPFPLRELDDATLTRAAVIGITSRELAIQDQQGDIYDQVEAGQLSWDVIVELR
jgi:hypothetical protein